MKNIHILPTDKPSRLVRHNPTGKIEILPGYIRTNPAYTAQNIYITSDEEIKEGDWHLYENEAKKTTKETLAYIESSGDEEFKKIILTTDQELIKDGVQAIDDEFLEWFVKNPSCESVEFKKKSDIWIQDYAPTPTSSLPPMVNLGGGYKIIIPKEEPSMVDKLKDYFNNTTEEQIQKDWDKTCEQTKGINSPTVAEFLEAQKQFGKQETLEEAVFKRHPRSLSAKDAGLRNEFLMGAKWQAERMYSEEEVLEILLKHQSDYRSTVRNTSPLNWSFDIKKWFEQFKKKKNGKS